MDSPSEELWLDTSPSGGSETKSRGRKPLYGITHILMVVSSICSGFPWGQNPSPKAVMSTLCFFKFWVGFGIGGDITLFLFLQQSWLSTRTRRLVELSWRQCSPCKGLGFLIGGFVSVVVESFIYRGSYRTSPSLLN